MEKHPPTGGGSTVTEVMDGCTETATGPLVTPAAVAVIVVVPLIGFCEESKPLHTTKIESQTPAHTRPAGDMVAIRVFEELKVNVVLTVVFAEFAAEALIVTTCPATSESEAGLTVTTATVVFAEGPLPQPAIAIKERKRVIRAVPVNRWRRAPFLCVLRSS